MEKYTITNYKSFKGFIGVILLFTLACTLNTAKLNDAKDVDEAKMVIDNFYQELKASKYINTLPLLSDTLLKTTDTTTLFNFYKKYQNENGNIISFKLVNCETKQQTTNKGTVLKAIAIYNVQRSNSDTQERFLLKSIDKNPLKIQRYDVVVDAIKK